MATESKILPIVDTNFYKILQTCLFLSIVPTDTNVTTLTVVTTVQMSSVFPYCTTTVTDHCRCVFTKVLLTYYQSNLLF